MKDTLDSMPTERTLEQESFANRKLIRPSLTRNDHNHNHGNHMASPAERRDRPERPSGGKKIPPAEQTNAENFYYQKQMQSKTSMVVVLRDGEELHGTIEWYDRNCLKLIRPNGQSNVLVYKPAIKYMFKEGEKS
jgi:sRNA-binding regulator protein Hfq